MYYSYQTDGGILQCPKCGEEMSQTLVGDEVYSKCEDCGYGTTE